MTTPAFDWSRLGLTVHPREPHAELLDTATHEVWLAPEPISRAEYDALVAPAPLVKSGHGRGAMDRAGFRRSPGASEDGPLREREIGGRRFQLVARPELDGARGAFPRRLVVHKFHVVAFDAGRRVPLLRTPEGRDYVQLVTPRGGDAALPAGWSLREVVLAAEWAIELPAPTETWWLANGASFQGPVDVSHARLATLDLPGSAP
jgi:hypothetical protein